MRSVLLAVAMALMGTTARAGGDAASGFDYYILSLSWSAAWCALEGDARNDPQCNDGRGLTFILHGLWPQHEEGWPYFCRTGERDPSRAQTAVMADIMGGSGLAFYQWRKHGRCSGLSARDYFQIARQAFDSIKVPEIFQGVDRPLTLPARVIEEAFIEANPGLSREQITITCRDGRIEEARICLTRDLAPRPCGSDVIRDCRLPDAILEAVR